MEKKVFFGQKDHEIKYKLNEREKNVVRNERRNRNGLRKDKMDTKGSAASRFSQNLNALNLMQFLPLKLNFSFDDKKNSAHVVYMRTRDMQC